MIRIIGVCLTAFFLFGCSAEQSLETQDHPLITAYSQAYNDKDIAAMTAFMHPDIEWLSVTGNKIVVEVSGKEALSTSMQEWFENPDLPKGKLRDWSLNGNYVAVTETAFWTTKEGEDKSQSALTVYELEDALIRRVYYYPSVTN